MLSAKHGGRFAWAIAAVAAVGALAPAARADFDPASVTTLQNLIDSGSTGITIGDKTFYNFSYQGSPATASDITISRPDSTDIGLQFNYNWTSANGNQDSVIRYCVHVNDTTPQNYINGVGLKFNGTTDPSGLLTNASVTESVTDLNGVDLSGSPISVIDFGPGNANNVDSASLTVDPAVRDLCVTKDISVHSAPGNLQGGTATISFVDNTFSQTPEPASLSLLGIGALLAFRRRR